MWLALVMAFNVRAIVRSNQHPLGLVPADDATMAKSTRMAMPDLRAQHHPVDSGAAGDGNVPVDAGVTRNAGSDWLDRA